MANGKFFVFEGIEASGKSSQIEMLASWAKEQKISAYFTREPGGTDVGDIIRELMATVDGHEMNKIARFFGFQMTRALLTPVIKEKLICGFNVFCDRWLYSTIAYQQYGDKMPSLLVEVCNAVSSNKLRTDRVYLLDIPVNLAMERLEKREDDIWFKRTEAYLQRVRNAYLEMASKSGKWLVIDGSMDKDEIQKCIRKDVKEVIG
jgi:dTMP kinase